MFVLISYDGTFLSLYDDEELAQEAKDFLNMKGYTCLIIEAQVNGASWQPLGLKETGRN
jgi:hypothetical protein